MKKTFIKKIKTKEIKHYNLPNYGEDFSEYREEISNYNFSEYLYSLRHINDFKNLKCVYLGY